MTTEIFIHVIYMKYNMEKNLEKRLNIASTKPLYKQEYILSLA